MVAEAYPLGVSRRKVEDLVQTLGVEKLSKSIRLVGAVLCELDDDWAVRRTTALRDDSRWGDESHALPVATDPLEYDE